MNEYESLVKGSMGIMLFASDTFAYACADTQMLSSYDFEWALPIIFKYGHPGEIAVMAWIRKQEPIKPWQTDKFKEAYAEIAALNPEVDSE